MRILMGCSLVVLVVVLAVILAAMFGIPGVTKAYWPVCAQCAKEAAESRAVYVPSAQQPQTTAAPTSAPYGPSVSKCEWLRANFPQSDGGVQADVANLTGNTIPLQRVAMHKYQCGDGTEVYDGGIVLGPSEGWDQAFSITVPYPGSVVDSYPQALFSGNHFRLSNATERATSGSVSGLRATFWPWWDENPPTGPVPAMTAAPAGQQPQSAPTMAAPPPPPPTSVPVLNPACVQPADLATQMGWKNLGWADKTYGGLRVELTQPSQMPPKWEAITKGRHIYQDDADRSMATGVWSIYPPFECRDALGFSK